MLLMGKSRTDLYYMDQNYCYVDDDASQVCATHSLFSLLESLIHFVFDISLNI